MLVLSKKVDDTSIIVHLPTKNIISHITIKSCIDMGFLGKLGDVFNKIDYHTSNEPHIVGKRFEDHVKGLFSNHFTIVRQTPEYKESEKRYIEQTKDPDFTFRYNPTGDEFAVECKYKTTLNKEGMLEWSYSDQIKRYQDYGKKYNIPVYIVIGFENVIEVYDNDEEESYEDIERLMFNLPLEQARYPALYTNMVKKFERPYDKPFFWDSKAKVLK